MGGRLRFQHGGQAPPPHRAGRHVRRGRGRKRGARGGRGGRGTPRVCWSCGVAGHLARDCSSNSHGSRGGGGGGAGGTGGSKGNSSSTSLCGDGRTAVRGAGGGGLLLVVLSSADLRPGLLRWLPLRTLCGALRGVCRETRELLGAELRAGLLLPRPFAVGGMSMQEAGSGLGKYLRGVEVSAPAPRPPLALDIAALREGGVAAAAAATRELASV
jgi:hypothetical protein